MVNVNNPVRQKYPEVNQNKPCSKDHERVDQLVVSFNQLLTLTERLVDYIVTFDVNEDDNCSG